MQTNAQGMVRHAPTGKVPGRELPHPLPGTEDTFEDICNRGRDAADHLDDGRWILGELAAQVATRYSEHTLDEFAKQVGAEKKRVYEYRQVWGRCSKILPLAEYRAANPMVRYSHYRDALRLKEPDQVRTWLDECSDNGYTVEEARVKLNKRLGKPVPPISILDATPCRIVGGSGSTVTFAFDDDRLAEMLRKMFYRAEGTGIEMKLTRKAKTA